ncbi:methyltransferase domain-containing protein [Mycolicibacterium frederiksbergense]|uniref:Class I SAM-dependent methyltransferase n=1 Tax=Mycolicibacterium frederiksbergense TaxID=117567 RepID=A0A6H0SFI4_9MYCO|nr:methyltransferase domain-containing protein [Mycolicibacterium frederiksbergense]QIV85085.1 class I SAM-dependent methyltransferase [Mycolicibacterium frederiksbergense]
MAAMFEHLIAEGAAADVTGWDFSWLDGRATEQRPPWGYVRLMSSRLSRVDAALDVQTGGGEVFHEALTAAEPRPTVLAATEAWPPNIAAAARLLDGVTVSAAPETELPFPDASFELVTSRHPATIAWGEIARVLRPGGSYLAQHVGPASAFELIEFFTGPQPEARRRRRPEAEAAAAAAAGLDVVDLRVARTRIEVFDVAAVVYLLRKVIWWVPDFTVERYRDRLTELHARIETEGPFIAHSTRHLIEARRPDVAVSGW